MVVNRKMKQLNTHNLNYELEKKQNYTSQPIYLYWFNTIYFTIVSIIHILIINSHITKIMLKSMYQT